MFARKAKLGWLVGGAETGHLPNAVPVERGPLDDFRPRPFGNGEWPSLRECFAFSKSGMMSGNDDVFVATTQEGLQAQVHKHLNCLPNAEFDNERTRRLVYRPLDLPWFYNDLRLLNRPGPQLQQVWDTDNIALYAMPGGTGAGPAVWCHGLLPDYHAFRGSYGGYAFPLHDRRPATAGPNLAPVLLHGLSAACGAPVAPGEVFDAILCLLSATSYTLRFAEDLEDVFPHIPFPARHDTFVQAARLGGEIRAVQTFARPPRDASFFRLVTTPAGRLDANEPDGDAVTLCEDGSGRVEGIPPALWTFEVSGYPVLRRWLDGRAGRTVDLALVEEFRDVCGRLAELLDLFGRADTLLDDALAAPLTRSALGFASA